MVTTEGVSVDLAKIEAILNWPRLTCVIEVRSFLVIVGYYIGFVEEFSKLVVSITKLLRKSNQFELSDECEASFQEFKKILALALVLALPTGSEGFVIYSDASKKGLG